MRPRLFGEIDSVGRIYWACDFETSPLAKVNLTYTTRLSPCHQFGHSGKYGLPKQA